MPNLIIGGAQKAGTTWLHHALKASAQLQKSDTKELNYFNRPGHAERLEEYAARFPQDSDAAYFYESSPNYLRPPSPESNVARNIATTLDRPAVLLLFRDPVDRYESAYVHHIAAGRREYTAEIDVVDTEFYMVDFGRYGTLLEAWQEWLPQTRTYLYDDLQDKPALIRRVMNDIGLDNDIDPEGLEFQVNAASVKQKRNGWPAVPRLTPAVRAQLSELYAPEVEKLQAILGRDLSHWLPA
nr:sulfotransferase domain-containing protein [Microbacterium sp. ZXX196]